MRHFLLCYDISDPRRLRKVHRITVTYAVFVQYSVYYFHGAERMLTSLIKELEKVIDNQADDVRAYCIEPLESAKCLGQPLMGEDLLLV